MAKTGFSHDVAHIGVQLSVFLYCNYPKILDTRKNCCKYPKIGSVSFFYTVMGPKDVDGMANSVDTDQTAPLV